MRLVRSSVRGRLRISACARACVCVCVCVCVSLLMQVPQQPQGCHSQPAHKVRICVNTAAVGTCANTQQKHRLNAWALRVCC